MPDNHPHDRAYRAIAKVREMIETPSMVRTPWVPIAAGLVAVAEAILGADDRQKVGTDDIVLALGDIGREIPGESE